MRTLKQKNEMLLQSNLCFFSCSAQLIKFSNWSSEVTLFQDPFDIFKELELG